MKTIIGIVYFLLTIHDSYSQNKFTINGTIKNGKTGESMIGATLIVKDIPQTVVASNAYGFYSLSIPQGIHNFYVLYTGYISIDMTL